jgi:hypothetical protein
MIPKNYPVPSFELLEQWTADQNKWTDFERVLAIRAAEWGYQKRCLEELSDLGQEMQTPEAQ